MEFCNTNGDGRNVHNPTSSLSSVLPCRGRKHIAVLMTYT